MAIPLFISHIVPFMAVFLPMCRNVAMCVFRRQLIGSLFYKTCGGFTGDRIQVRSVLHINDVMVDRKYLGRNYGHKRF